MNRNALIRAAIAEGKLQRLDPQPIPERRATFGTQADASRAQSFVFSQLYRSGGAHDSGWHYDPAAKVNVYWEQDLYTDHGYWPLPYCPHHEQWHRCDWSPELQAQNRRIAKNQGRKPRLASDTLAKMGL